MESCDNAMKALFKLFYLMIYLWSGRDFLNKIYFNKTCCVEVLGLLCH